MAPITRRNMTLHSTIIIQLRASIAHFHCSRTSIFPLQNLQMEVAIDGPSATVLSTEKIFSAAFFFLSALCSCNACSILVGCRVLLSPFD